MNTFEAIDYIFIVVLFLSVLFGYARGFIREFFTVANLFLAGALTFFLYPYSYKFFGDYVVDENIIKACSIFVVFIIAWILIIFINSFVIDMLSASRGKGLDRFLGIAFGLFRGALMIIFFYIGLVVFYDAKAVDENLPDWMRKAKTHNFVRMQSEWVLDYMPDSIQKSYDQGGDGVIDEAITALTRNGPLTDDEKRLRDYGFSMDNIETLKKIIRDMPVGYGRDRDFPGVAKLPKGEFIDYMDFLLEDYDAALAEGRIEPILSNRKIQALRRVVQEMKAADNPVKEGVY